VSKDLSILKVIDLTIAKKKRNTARYFLKDIRSNYRTGYLVNGMSLSITRNKIHGVVGESGSGKSLTMKSILGLIDFSPGIIGGNIKYFEQGDPINVIPKSIPSKKNSFGALKWIMDIFQQRNSLLKTEYFIVSPEEGAFKLSHIPDPDSIKVYKIVKHNQCIQTDYDLPSLLNPRLIKLKQLPEDISVIAISYVYQSTFSSYRSKKLLNLIQKTTHLRGEKIAIILQDPQSFLNPYWPIEKQIKNIIKKRKTILKDSLYLERNYTLRIIGSKKDFPVTINWDKTSFKSYLRQADIWNDGKSYSLMSYEGLLTIKGSTRFWGLKSVGKKFTLVIHPNSSKSTITIKWDKNSLYSNVLQATLSIPLQRDGVDVDMLNNNTISIDPSIREKDGNIKVEIELIIGSGNDFILKLEVDQCTDKCDLVIGLERGATGGLDLDKGEKPITTSVDGFYAGFAINNKKNDSQVLSHRDIRAPIDILNAEATLTITPKYDQDYIGNINLHSASGKTIFVQFGLLSSATEKTDAHLVEKDISDTLREGYFEAGFTIKKGNENEILSRKDIRNLQINVDIDTEISTLLSKVDLDDEDKEFRKQLPREISGGQGQRVMISLAMAAKPEVLIADEPTTGLDVTKQTEIVELFRQYKDQGRTIILISHDLNFIRKLADSYTIVYAGCDVEHISNQDLYNTDNLHPYTRRLLSIANRKVYDKFDYINKDVPDPYRADFHGCPFEPRCEEKDMVIVTGDKHPCNFLLPPMIHVATGEIAVDLDQVKESHQSAHFIRCWLYFRNLSKNM